MTQQQHDNLDHLMTGHFSVMLEPEVGRAAAAFRKHVETGGGVAEGPAAIAFAKAQAAARGGNVIPRRALWYWAGVPSALAACLALVLMLQFFNGNGTVTRNGVGTDGHPANAGTISFDSNELSRDIDGGVAVLSDETPVRLFHRQGVRKTQWIDPDDHATYSVTEPVEKVGYIQIQPY